MENLSNEIWKDVIGYEGLYIVNNFGIVKSVKRTVRKINRYKTYTNQPIPEKIKYGTPDKDGYLKIGLWKDNKIKTISIHRIVANAFIPNPYNLPQINHIDENKENNHVSNLEVVTKKDNMRKAVLNGQIKTGEDCCRSVSVAQINPVTNKVVKTFGSINIATKETKISGSGISNVINGHRLSAGGFLWKKI